MLWSGARDLAAVELERGSGWKLVISGTREVAIIAT